METKKIVVRESQSCGKKFFYPDNENAEIALSITKASTGRRVALTKNDLDSLKRLGLEVEIKRAKVIYD